MITCKEDLIGFYALREDKEVFELFMDKCEEFGLRWILGEKPRKEQSGEGVLFGHELAPHCIACASEKFLTRNGIKKLTLSNLKPTRTEYVRVDDSIFDLKAEFEAGELYMPDGNYGFCSIPSCDEDVFVMKFNDKCVYRKVEHEATWQDEVERLYPVNAINGHVSFKRLITDAEFIELCHKVYHLTK